MCNPGKFFSRATGIGANDRGPNYGTVDHNTAAMYAQNAGLSSPAPSAPSPAPAPQQPAAPSGPTPDVLAADYTKFYRPQIDSQYGNAQNALNLGLADRGLTGSNIDKNYSQSLTDAYNQKVSSLNSDARNYGSTPGSTGTGFTPLGDLFTSLIKPVATFNAGNSFGAPGGAAGMATAPSVSLSNGSRARVVG